MVDATQRRASATDTGTSATSPKSTCGPAPSGGSSQDQLVRHPKTPSPPALRDRQVNAGRERIGQPVHHQRGVVAEAPFATRPEPELDQLLVLGVGQVHDPVDEPTHALDPVAG